MNDKRLPLLLHHGIVVGDKLYFANCDLNGLYKLDLVTKECKFVSFFPDELIIQIRLYLYACYSKGYIIFSPYYASHIAIFNIKTGEFTTYNVPQKYWWKKELCGFLSVCVYNQYAYFYGTRETILRLNLETGEMKFWDEASLGINIDGNGQFGMQIRKNGNYIYNIIVHKNILFRFSLLTEKMECFPIELSEEQLYCVEANDDRVWLISNKNIWEWSEEKYKLYIHLNREFNLCHWATFCDGEQFYLNELNTYEIVKVSKHAPYIKALELNKGLEQKMIYVFKEAVGLNIYQDYIITFSTYDNSIYILNRQFEIVDKICLIDKETDKFKKFDKNENNIYEGEPSVNTLERMFDKICSEKVAGCYKKEWCDIGKEILETVVSETQNMP